MTFNEGARLDSSRVRTSRGGRGVAVGGGLGVLALVVLSQLLGIDLTALGDGLSQGSATSEATSAVEGCETGADANQDVSCRVVGALNSLDAYWAQALPAAGKEFVQPGAEIFEVSVQTGCGNATSAVGPFYCPADQSMYIDTGFYDDLRTRFGSSGGPLAEMYVVAHEYGHHIEQITGLMDQADRTGTGPGSDSVRIELTADCLAGMWARNASTVPDPVSGVPFLQPLTPEEIADALSAAAAVGDDRIQEQATGTVSPEAWTHGSSEQRQQWFLVGFEGGTLDDCNALAAESL
ncbi:neutral zinc metallopeptidase [Actinotalea sp. K2]|uniref:KPN_02809 family neutral zinc metallopeptidase n=1 Tax=Actinotalea sp. K2 TaxID=2939438 RepID=UPI0020181B94|nr:neutral zinc metallopeptidase [Actinotalea sp. K2]MCL3861956.1 neutral zinc metallopeptidase [Actinotalea sp. K2]